jgi:hypothetical protein
MDAAQRVLEIGPAELELLGIGHVGHRAAGREVRQDHLLMRRAQDVGALGHEVHAAEHDEVGLGVGRHALGQLVRVAGVVGELDDLVALVVVAEDDEASAERGAGGGDAGVHDLVGQTEVGIGQRLPLRQMTLFVLGEERNQHRRSGARPRACETFLNLGTRKSQTPNGPSRRELGV